MVLNVSVEGGDSPRPSSHRRVASGQMLVSRIKAYIQSNLGDSDLSPAEIADAHGISKRYLHQVFAETGTSVGAWLRRERLSQARAVLENPRSLGRSITEVAFDCGFADPAHFSRSFKAVYGATPSSYRKQRMQRLKPV